MPYLESVEEARYYVKEAIKDNDQPSTTIGDDLDAVVRERWHEWMLLFLLFTFLCWRVTL